MMAETCFSSVEINLMLYRTRLEYRFLIILNISTFFFIRKETEELLPKEKKKYKVKNGSDFKFFQFQLR